MTKNLVDVIQFPLPEIDENQSRIVSSLFRCESGLGNALVGPTTTPTRASETRFILRSRDPVERLVWDAVLSEKEAQLGRMFLHVTHAVQEQL